jgi:hypothetical protein
MNELRIRKPNRLHNYDYNQNGAYFVTICVKDRAELLGEIVRTHAVGATVPGRPPFPKPRMSLSPIGTCVDDAITYYNTYYGHISFDRYVIMPNHIHIIMALRSERGDGGRSPLQYIVRNLKSFVTKQNRKV